MTPGRRAARHPAKTVAVVGGGIAGLAAAWELTGGIGGPRSGSPAVVVLEAGDRLGGKLHTETIGGRPVDVGPDGFLGRRPEAAALCYEVGIGEDLVPISATGAAVWVGGRRRTLPESLYLGIPTRFMPIARSGILGPRGALRLLVDVLAPRRDVRGPLGDLAIGPLVAHKLGRRVVDRLVDPLIGGIHAGGVDDMSAAAVFPLLLAVAQRRTGFMRSLRRARATAEAVGSASPVEAEPAFWALRRGAGSLVDRLVELLVVRGVTVRTASPVDLLDHHPGAGAPWVLHTSEGPVVADGVVLAVPPGPAADLLAPHEADVATLLRGIELASVTVVTLEYPEAALGARLVGTGLLVPRGTPVPGRLHGGGTFMVTACTYLSAKWPHLSSDGHVLLRASVGRFGDDRATALGDEALVARVVSELGVLLRTRGAPVATRVTRWPDAFPQYRIHHLLRVAGIESGVRRYPALAVAGSAYRGVGIPACIAGGRAAAQEVLEGLSGKKPDKPPAP